MNGFRNALGLIYSRYQKIDVASSVEKRVKIDIS